MATWIDALASRSGPLLTAASHFAASHGLERDPPRGVSGLRTLSGLISCAQRDAEQDDNHFVAGAGAYLGLLLLDHLPGGAHVTNAGEHRLRLSAHGFFDPFAAVATALEAPDAPRALLEAVKLAEAEAAGSGPIARVADELMRTLADQPSVRLVRQFEHRMWLEVDGANVEVDLARVISVTRGESDAMLQYAVRRLCAALVREATPVLGWDAARERLFPRLVGRSFLSSLPNTQDLFLEPLGGEVWVTLVLRFRERARYVRRAEVDAWSDAGDVNVVPMTQAIENLARSCGAARFLQHATEHGPVVVAESRDGLDAARLVLPGLHEVLSATLGSSFVAAVPHRDTLLACPAEPPELVEELARRVDAAVKSAPHAIAPTLWLVTGPGRMRPLVRG